MTAETHLGSLMPSLTEGQSHPNHWHNRASDLRAAAGALWFAMENERATEVAKSLRLGGGFSMGVACWGVYHMMCGLALELAIKAVIVQRGFPLREIHDLNQLAADIGVSRSPHEKALLKFYTSSIIWAGRYPVPKQCDDEKLRRFYKEANDVLTKPGPMLGPLRLSVSSDATDWDQFHELWLRFSNEFSLDRA